MIVCVCADRGPQAQWVCFQRIYDEVFLSFQETQAYVDVQKSEYRAQALFFILQPLV